jgi:acetyltransferase
MSASSEELIDLRGVRVTLRPIRADDAAMHDAFIAGLDPVDLRFRFGGRIAEVPHPERERMTKVDPDREITFVATVRRDDGDCEILGEVRARADPYGARAEFAIAVRSDRQRLGLGRVLLEKVVRFCRENGVRQLYGLVAPTNTGMLALARRLGFDVDHVPGGTTAVVSLAP